jgi:multicomponent Na+:H+ antiporter subunit D
VISAETALAAAPVIPLVGALLILLCGSRPNLRETVSLGTAVLLVAAVLVVVMDVLAGGRPALVTVEMFPNLPLAFAAEPLGAGFALVASGLWLVTGVYSIGYMRGHHEGHQTRFYAFFAVSLAATMAVAFAGNVMTLFVFYELLTLVTYPLVTHHGTPEAKRAGRVYFGILIGTSIGLQLPAIAAIYLLAGTLDFTAGGILAGKAGPEAVAILYAMFILGIAKAALMPFHRWLPAAMVAPTPVSALLHAVAVVKTGVFAVLKITVYVFGVELLQTTPGNGWLIYVAGFTIVAASTVALFQDNLKRRLAYSTISQLSYVVIGAAVLNSMSLQGATLQIATHAVAKITLFFAAGAILVAADKTQVSELDGIGRRMPWTMGAFAVASLSMIGLPPTGGFVAKWYLLQGALAAEQVAVLAVLVVSTLLNAAYFLPIVYAAFFRPLPVGGREHGEAPLASVGALTLTAALSVFLFFRPDLPLQLAQAFVAVAR